VKAYEKGELKRFGYLGMIIPYKIFENNERIIPEEQRPVFLITSFRRILSEETY